MNYKISESISKDENTQYQWKCINGQYKHFALVQKYGGDYTIYVNGVSVFVGYDIACINTKLKGLGSDIIAYRKKETSKIKVGDIVRFKYDVMEVEFDRRRIYAIETDKVKISKDTDLLVEKITYSNGYTWIHYTYNGKTGNNSSDKFRIIEKTPKIRTREEIIQKRDDLVKLYKMNDFESGNYNNSMIISKLSLLDWVLGGQNVK